ncbi:MAG TPA: hypothetical protein DDZ51_03700 [Planctomycetaceae bacterium]|nr:hypothetical protein [Planctomycetaceae bacterium]
MNATQTAQSLLSLPQDVSAPDPYAVLGLKPGESDPAKIAAAIKSIVAQLNSVKASADPAAWNQAAIWVKESRRIVSDPALKARLDQKIGTSLASASSAVVPPTSTPAVPAFDPLAGFLPGQASNSPAGVGQAPLPPAPVGFGEARNTAFRPGNAPSSPGIAQPPSFAPRPGFAQQPTHYAAVPPGPVYGSMQPSNAGGFDQSGGGVAVAGDAARELGAIAKPQSSGRRRKKRFPWASLVLVLLTLASIGGIVAMVVYLTKNPGGITIALQPGVDGAVPVAGSNFAVAPPVARDDSPPDPVMGRLPAARTGRNAGRNSVAEATDSMQDDFAPSGTPDDRAGMASSDAPNPDMAAENPAMTPSPDSMPSAATITDPSMANIPQGNAPPTEIPNMADIPGVVEPTPEKLQTAQAALVTARQVLATAKWDQMNAAAEAAVKAAATAEQKQMADQLVELAELATYYQVGVEKALDGLKANETFNVTEQLQVSLVEITPDKVVLRFNGRNKDYVRSELPLVIAHKIAGFTMPIDAPATKAAAQVYQALAPVTTPQYREQAIKALEAMPPQPDDVDPAVLVAAIRQVFPK